MEAHTAGAWDAWYAVTKGQNEHYVPDRIAYVSNLTAFCTCDLWAAFQARWGGRQLLATCIPDIVAEWTALYNVTQQPENRDDCYMPDDILPPARFQAMLSEHVGAFLSFRVD